ncbi:hypothetical protein SO802_032490 [Lithocarpus litseifolius]|uniref:tryptophan synthase n=1 Tax=Lithocarpus litseifolius TaxID=425828 RepID=A0AAW2BFT4_9ROSI
MATPPTAAVDFDNECAYYKSKPDLACAVLNEVNQQFNVVNNTQSQPLIANTNVVKHARFYIKYCLYNDHAYVNPYTMAGDSDLSTTAEALKVLDSHGSDIFELGTPHFDPLVDAPIIQVL